MATWAPSISVKMILTTTLLIIVTVVGSGLLNVVNIRRAFDDSVAQQVNVFKRGRQQLGELGTPQFARAVEPLLIEHQDGDIALLVKNAVGQDASLDPTGRIDYGLKLAYVLDLNQNLVVSCVEGTKLECKPGLHTAATADSDPLIRDSWTMALAQWKQNLGKSDALVNFELPSEGANGAKGATYHVFAYPVFVGEPATPAAALPTEPTSASRQGYVVLGYDLAPVEWFASTVDDRKAAAATKAALYTGVVGALFALIGTVLAIFQGLSITRPIRELAWKADQIARGDLEARVEVTSGDEIGFLGKNFNYMADQIEVLLEQTIEKAKLEQELEVAKAIQETLVPSDAPVKINALTFAGYYQPAAQTGGDWWTWSQLVGSKVLLMIGDVTGHGIPSAMITAAAKAACDVARYVHRDEVTVTRLLEVMNHAIFESAQRRFVMTCFASIIDTKARTITYANAGHNFPYLFRADDSKGEFGSLIIRGNRLGDERNSKYESKTTDLATGDVLIWYTDGVVECENHTGEEYGDKRFRASIRRAAKLDAGEMRNAIIADANEYFGDTFRKDDITMVIGRIH